MNSYFNESELDFLSLLSSNTNDTLDLVMESASDSHVIAEHIFPIIENALSSHSVDIQFKQAITAYVDRNSEKLHEPAPMGLIPFTDNDKELFFRIIGIDQNYLKKIIGEALGNLSSTASFQLVKQNPIFVLFYAATRYYMLKNDRSGVNSTLVIHALSVYPSVFSKYFPKGVNTGVMRYTADTLSERFFFKQYGTVLGALKASIDAAYQYLKGYMKEGNDKEIIRYVQRVRNDQNSIMKKIRSQFDENYKKGNTITTQTETYGDNGALIDDLQNDTSKVEIITQKIMVGILTNGINLSILSSAATISQISVSELRLYIGKILVKSRTEELEEFINAVLFTYLYTEKHEAKEIKSKAFMSFGLELFRKTNSNDKNISIIKDTLGQWAKDVGIYTRFTREGTWSMYKKGIYWYLLLSIQYFC